MSKTDSSLRLLAILRFTVPSNSSRTLNATQAYDTASSGITLASAIGTLVDNSVAVKAQRGTEAITIGLSLRTAGVTNPFGTADAEKREAAADFGASTVELGVVKVQKKQSAKACDAITTLRQSYGPATTLNFNGDQVLLGGNVIKTNPNTTFYGGIPVATGDYKKWQGKYAVLKINTVTGKGVLRIYDA